MSTMVRTFQEKSSLCIKYLAAGINSKLLLFVHFSESPVKHNMGISPQ